MRKAKQLFKTGHDFERKKYKHTSIGNSRNTRVRNKNKKRIKKVLPNGKPMYRGQGKWTNNMKTN